MDSIAEGRRQWDKHYASDAALGLTAISSAARAAHLLRAGAEDALAPFGVSFAHFELLTLLMWSRSGALPMSKISTRLHMPPASLTHTVRRLEGQGLVARVTDEKDKRSTLLTITDQGIALASAAGPVLSDYCASLDQDAAAKLVDAAAIFRRAAGDDVE